MVYIGKAGTIDQSGDPKKQCLRDRINNIRGDMKPQDFFNSKVKEKYIDGLDIYWFVTMDESKNDLPGYVEGLLMQRFFEIYGSLPIWNKEF